MFGKVVIGVDGRQGGRDAIALARHLASPDASFTLVYVYGHGPISWWRHQRGEERPFDREVSMLATERERAGIQAGIACVPGPSPAAGLHHLANTIAADLIVVGASRHTPPGRVLLGDDASASLHGAPCPIAVAPRGYTRSAFPTLNRRQVGALTVRNLSESPLSHRRDFVGDRPGPRPG